MTKHWKPLQSSLVLTGLAASAAAALAVETYTAVFGAIAFFLVLGSLLYRILPGPRTAGTAAREPSQSPS